MMLVLITKTIIILVISIANNNITFNYFNLIKFNLKYIKVD